MIEKHGDIKDLLWSHLIPNMRMLFMISAPDKYAAWSGNCCRQSAMMTHMAMSKNGEDSGWIVERTMTAMLQIGVIKTWDHAFYSLEAESGHLKIDMSLRQKYPIWHYDTSKRTCTRSYPAHLNECIAGIPDYDLSKDMIQDPHQFEDRPEYYTGLTMRQIYDFCIKLEKPSKEILNELRTSEHLP